MLNACGMFVVQYMQAPDGRDGDKGEKGAVGQIGPNGKKVQ